MLNLALVGLMAGSLAVSPADDGKKGTDAPKADAAPVAAVAGPSIFTTTPAASPETVQDTYAFGRSYERSPLRLWVSYAYGEAEGRYDTAGNSGGGAQEITIAGTDGDIVSQRVNAGIELGLPVSLIGFGLSGGAQVTMAKNDFQVGAQPGPVLTQNLESTFGLQAAKFYGELSTGTVGIHAGYHLDLGEQQSFAAPNPALGGAQIPTNLSNSDDRNAAFFGASFDYPSERLRLFGALDYYDVYSPEDNPGTVADESTRPADNDLMNAMLGLGLRFNVIELGAALQIQSRFNGPIVENLGPDRIGGSVATIAPYLRISPPTFPASLFVKGAVQNEYTEFGYPIGGSNSVKPSIGFTAGLTFGFN